MAVLLEPFSHSHGSKAAFDKFKCASLTLFWANVTTENFDRLRRPAIATIEDGVGCGELRHRRNEHFDGFPVDLNPDDPPHEGRELVDGLKAPVPGEHADVMLQVAPPDSLRLHRPATRIAALALREWSPARTAYDARLAQVSCSLC